MDTQNTLNAAPLDAAAAAKAAFAAVEGFCRSRMISFTAPELRWAVIGCGVIANQMAQSPALAGRKVYGVADRQSPARCRRPSRPNMALRACIRAVEAVACGPSGRCHLITTPRNTPYRVPTRALAAGKHVLCEKAITLNSDELAEARAIADEHHVVLMDATTVLHMPLYVELMRRVREGEFGRLRLAQVNFGSFHDYEDMQNRFWNRSLAGGAMLDIGVYAYSVARLFMESQPNEVVSLANLFKTGVDEERLYHAQCAGTARRVLPHHARQAAQAR
ncbi:MAG: Gfo/Idh/MocA family protein [Collinsella sp.]